MMVPIVLSVIDVALRRRTGKGLTEHGGIPTTIATCATLHVTLLGVAYGRRSGLGTIIGSPPTGSWFATSTSAGVQVTFLQWMLIAFRQWLAFLPWQAPQPPPACFRRG